MNHLIPSITRKQISEIRKRAASAKSWTGKEKQFLVSVGILEDSKHLATFHKVISNVVDFTLPARGQVFRLRTQTQLNLIALVLEIVSLGAVAELTVATYTINKNCFTVLLDLLKSSQIKRLNFLIASSYSFRDEKHYEYMKSACRMFAEKYDIHLVFAWSHFKITLARCENNYFHVEGSMNYSQNNMAENLVLSNDRELYEFDYQFITETMRSHENKALEIVC